MSDLISRKALCDYALNQKDKSVTPNDIMRFPSAQPEQWWIPVSERMPKPQEYGDEDYSDWVQITLHIGENNDVVGRGYYCFNKRKWYADRLGVGVVTAWMPSPEPYKGETKIVNCTNTIGTV